MVKLGEASVSVNYIELLIEEWIGSIVISTEYSYTFLPFILPEMYFLVLNNHGTCQTLCQALRLVETDALIILTAKK